MRAALFNLLCANPSNYRVWFNVFCNNGTGSNDLGDYTTAWGGNAFPAGKAIKNAPAIPAKPGSYKVVFNDLLGMYRFIDK